MKDIKKVLFNGEEYEIKKIAIRKYSEFGKAFLNLPDFIKDIITGTLNGTTDLSENLFEILPEVIIQAPETVGNLLSIATDIDKDLILDGGLDDFLELALAVKEINNLELIGKKIKKFTMNQSK